MNELPILIQFFIIQLTLFIIPPLQQNHFTFSSRRNTPLLPSPDVPLTNPKNG
jgi:hypothetical protein